MVCTSDEELKNIITSIRSHGWDRDLDKPVQQKLRQENNVEEFKSLYTFYYPGFNCRSTDLQAFIGLKQLEKINYIVEKRRQNFDFYNKYLDSKFKVHLGNHQFVSNFAFPIISTNINKLVYNLNLNGVETRPLICGSIGSQPFWINLYGKIPLKNADTVDKFGIYIPNNPSISEEEIQLMSDIVNKFG
jgi:CDP-6-deoxy-D-xylo-4-hexulose-3-dehydrase